MYSLFQWHAARDIGPWVLSSFDTDHFHIIEILQEIRDEIDPVFDGQPSNAVYVEAKKHYEELLKSGCIDNPVLGDGDSMTKCTASASHSCSCKWPAEGSTEGTKTSKQSMYESVTGRAHSLGPQSIAASHSKH